ncbi:DegT/DnrJ/EryC1/StrS family aminotransferase [Shewanella kaireitica]|uniref:DegT/DnrJ/EryC1/StrS family aminotransferase n=1 Tax=Shewanella kaireitica TaxID=212021 RepID=UPI00200EDDB1|nr:DegT/DnrJ/EryC1/StrS family aminotransferase [Shewanella kaireitica]
MTQPSLASLDDFSELLSSPWRSGVLTHNGPLVQQLENDLCIKLNLNNFTSVVNGTMALQLAIKALQLKGQIITTPFSWVATVSSIKWENCKPIFCDIDPETLNIDVNKIESLITDDTVAIMPVHVFGNPCDIIGIEEIAKRHKLPVIYDAAHAVGSTFNGNSILNYGDISATSLHATKIFNCGEGGGCVTNSELLRDKIRRLRFFGHDDEKNIVEDGLNGKMTEIHAALGILNLKEFDSVLAWREHKYKLYLSRLAQNEKLSFQKLTPGTNYSYFPVIFDEEATLLKVVKVLNDNNVFPRRYFYPSLNTLTNIVDAQDTPVSEDIAKRILCLPLYTNLSDSDIDRISTLINTI